MLDILQPCNFIIDGLIITKIHSVIQFTQSPIFRDYIDYNSKRRQEAKNDFEKDFYKQKITLCLARVLKYWQSS